eukprot:3710393-Amphidinium_carterae.2
MRPEAEPSGSAAGVTRFNHKFREQERRRAEAAGEVRLEDLDPETRRKFEGPNGADEAEWFGILKTNLQALVVHHGAAAETLRAQWPERIVGSRMVRRLKPQAGIGTPAKPKSRFCVLGHQDPDTALLKVYAPTPGVEIMMTFWQVTASMRFSMTVLDVKQAFVQGLPLKREKGPILVQPCPGLPIPASSVIELKVALCGLDDAPYQWRQTLISEMKGLGFERCLLDACVWILRGDRSEPRVIALLDVDDIVISGQDQHTAPVLSRLRSRFHIGKEESGTSEFCGRRLHQRADGSITVDMAKYIVEKLREIPMGKKEKKDRALSQPEFEGLRSLVYKLAWLGRETRPEMAGASSMMAARLNKATVADILEANALMRYLQATAERKLVIHPIPLQQMH